MYGIGGGFSKVRPSTLCVVAADRAANTAWGRQRRKEVAPWRWFPKGGKEGGPWTFWVVSVRHTAQLLPPRQPTCLLRCLDLLRLLLLMTT